MRKLLENSRLLGVLRVIYYRYAKKVHWRPSYDLVHKLYIVEVEGLSMKFITSPFYDVEYALLDYVRSLPVESSKVFLDAGSFIGTFAIYAASLSSTNFVAAVEPDPVNRQLLEKNIELNKLANIHIIAKCLWDSETTLSFSSGNGEMSGVEAADHEPEGTIELEATTIDALVRKLSMEFDYVKMDIEGAEIEALEGAKGIIQSSKPKFVVASYHLREGSQTKARVEQFLSLYYKNIYSTNNGQLLSIAAD
jgi:FkbM family methyltransferase